MSGLHASPSSLFGLEDWVPAAIQAVGCGEFRPDVEEEQIADEKVS